MGIEFTFAGIASVVIPFLVNMIKKVKFIGNKYAPVVAFVLGAIAGAVGHVYGILDNGMTLIQAIIVGVGIGGTSTGLYDLKKKLSE